MATQTLYPNVINGVSISVLAEDLVTVVTSAGISVTLVQESSSGAFVLPEYYRSLVASSLLLTSDPLALSGDAVSVPPVTRVSAALVGEATPQLFSSYVVGGDWALAIQAALDSSAQVVRIPYVAGGYDCKSKITVPAGKLVEFQVGAKLNHKYNGVMIELLDGCGLIRPTLDGMSGAYTGYAVLFSGANGRQTIENIIATDFEDPCMYFELSAGSECIVSGYKMYRHNAPTGSGRYAIVMEDAFMDGAVPRMFYAGRFGGQASIDFGGCNNVFVLGAYMADVRFSDDSRAVQMIGVRIGNQSSVTLRGHNNVIIGDIGPQWTIGANADNCHLFGSMNRHPIVDSSTNNRNVFNEPNIYAPDIYSPEISGTGNKLWEFNATKSGGGPNISAWSGAGFPIKIKITTGGSLGTAQYQVSLDGGANYESTVYTTPGGGSSTITYGGATAYLTWTAGTYVLNETYTWTPPTVVATFHRHGSQTTVVLEMHYGTGAAWTFNPVFVSLPQARQGTDNITMGQVHYIDISANAENGAIYPGFGVIVGAVNKVQLFCPRVDGLGGIGEFQSPTTAAPFTWAVGDYFRASFTYTN